MLFDTPPTAGAMATVWWPFAAVETPVVVPPSGTMPAANTFPQKTDRNTVTMLVGFHDMGTAVLTVASFNIWTTNYRGRRPFFTFDALCRYVVFQPKPLSAEMYAGGTQRETGECSTECQPEVRVDVEHQERMPQAENAKCKKYVACINQQNRYRSSIHIFGLKYLSTYIPHARAHWIQ
ncbi:hypothetical protein HDG34_000785 [Paraburkholderia sp. HC6.4b]|uniref:hypothetical protein n=1 Tax=unclassified Paraburkholderia TaxID=2615204 RepID=UPI0017AA6D24|nr:MULTISPECIES: hypothetical protein [unclassified Paraburkholderia]MBB5406864.1 hypothetical protein [Paraburkholderia sp. HC6.4b]MBB5449067.1 hypothetical protein [Paraburkholderia sp. Kb1A]